MDSILRMSKPVDSGTQTFYLLPILFPFFLLVVTNPPFHGNPFHVILGDLPSLTGHTNKLWPKRSDCCLPLTSGHADSGRQPNPGQSGSLLGTIARTMAREALSSLRSRAVRMLESQCWWLPLPPWWGRGCLRMKLMELSKAERESERQWSDDFFWTPGYTSMDLLVM